MNLKSIQWQKGFFRIWIVFSIIFLICAYYIQYQVIKYAQQQENFDEYQKELIPVDCSENMTGEIGEDFIVLLNDDIYMLTDKKYYQYLISDYYDISKEAKNRVVLYKRALVNAHKAGDVEAARLFAKKIISFENAFKNPRKKYFFDSLVKLNENQKLISKPQELKSYIESGKKLICVYLGAKKYNKLVKNEDYSSYVSTWKLKEIYKTLSIKYPTLRSKSFNLDDFWQFFWITITPILILLFGKALAWIGKGFSNSNK